MYLPPYPTRVKIRDKVGLIDKTGTIVRYGIKLLGAIVATGLFAFPALAGNAALSWTPPTHNTNGTTLTNLTGFRVLYGTSPTALTQVVQINSASQVAYTVEGLAPGQWHFTVRAVSATGESINSNLTTKTVLADPTVPNAPVVTIADLTVFTIAKRPGGFLLLPVGTVPAGTQCDPAQTVNGKYAVPVSAVTWTGSARSDVVVVATCN